MKSTFVLAALLTLVTATPKAKPAVCPANNCIRAIAGDRVLPVKLADCNSFFAVTVTPAATTTTSTATEYSIVGNHAFNSLSSRTIVESSPAVTVTATNIPAYAVAACTSKNADLPARYSSACSCASATHTTVTVANPSNVVEYVTTTVTVSSFKVMGTAAVMTPSVQILHPDENISGPNYLASLFVATDPNDGSAVWSLSNGNLRTYKGQFSQQDSGPVLSEWVWLDYPDIIAAKGWIYIHFIADPITLALTAVSSETGNSVLQVCTLGAGPGYYLDLSAVAGTSEQTTGSPCYPVTLHIVPLS